jgi:hypothetical protein
VRADVIDATDTDAIDPATDPGEPSPLIVRPGLRPAIDVDRPGVEANVRGRPRLSECGDCPHTAHLQAE